jgi:hypothetical protein
MALPRTQSSDSFCTFKKDANGTLEVKLGQGFTKATVFLILALSGALSVVRLSAFAALEKVWSYFPQR